MKCTECRDLMLTLSLGELPEDQRQDVDGHLATCPSCRVEFQRLQSICRVLEDDAQGDGLTELEKLRLESAVYRRLATGERSAGPIRSRLVTTFARLAAAIVLFALGYSAHSYRSGRVRPGAVIVAEQAHPSYAEYARGLNGGVRFSAAGLKMIAQGRKATLTSLENIFLQRSGTR